MNRKFGRKSDHRNHMLRNLATSLILYEKVDTTEAKSKEIKSIIDRILSQSKSNDLTARRIISSYFFDKNAVRKIMDELHARYKQRSSGFVNSYHLKNRLGDNSPMVRLELVDSKIFIEEKKSDLKEAVKTEKTQANVSVRKRNAETK